MGACVPKEARLSMRLWFLTVKTKNDGEESSGPMLILKTDYLLPDKEASEVTRDMDAVCTTDASVDNFTEAYAEAVMAKNDAPEYESFCMREQPVRTSGGLFIRSCTHFFVCSYFEFTGESVIGMGRHFMSHMPYRKVDIELAEKELGLECEDNRDKNMYILDSISDVYGLPVTKSSKILENKEEHVFVYETSALLDDFFDRYKGNAENLSVLVRNVRKMVGNC